MSISLIQRNVFKVCRNISSRLLATSSVSQVIQHPVIVDPPEVLELEPKNFGQRNGETLDQRKARLLYQSRKRGMLENGLILSTFAQKYLPAMDSKQVQEYDKIINLPSNEWDLYNWALDVKPTPAAFNNSVMDLLKQHAKNTQGEKRFRQPDLYEDVK